MYFQERVQQYEGFVADHQQYNDAYNQCIEWLNTIREKLSLCADIAGDRHTIQNRLDKIQVCFYYRFMIFLIFMQISDFIVLKGARFHSYLQKASF